MATRRADACVALPGSRAPDHCLKQPLMNADSQIVDSAKSGSLLGVFCVSVVDLVGKAFNRRGRRARKGTDKRAREGFIRRFRRLTQPGLAVLGRNQRSAGGFLSFGRRYCV